MQLTEPDPCPKTPAPSLFIWAMFGVVGADSLNCLKTNYRMDSKIGFEMNLIVVVAIRGRYESFMILTATVSEKFLDRQTLLF